ncbi:fam-l protein [Plasmodium brasilianum]|uniref:Fam-l protein n=2 Tax=Plasmodium (Plasmodium) TaxID=418103 RepID=A0A1A8WV50_PLAMA|nr:fam-l protein [Plasmodium brasilianum]SBS96213.1 Plasmodium exported protein (Pm-fam-a like), unknown function [Plasmodium malariae]
MKYNGTIEKKYICCNGKDIKRKNKQSNDCSQKSSAGNKCNTKNKSCIFETKKYPRLERKIFKELDYENFLKNNRTISDNIYKKIMCKKWGIRLSLPTTLFLLLSISLILDLFVGYGFVNKLIRLLNFIFPDKKWISTWHDWLWTSGLNWMGVRVLSNVSSNKKSSIISSVFANLIYLIPLIILGLTVILAVFYYHKKVKNYEKIKLRKI